MMSDDDIAFLDGLFDAFDDLPDGAWQAACEEAVRNCPRFEGENPYDVLLMWIEANNG